MGFKFERNSEGARREWSSTPEERLRIAQNLAETKIDLILREGAIVLNNGKGFIPHAHAFEVPAKFQQAFSEGRIIKTSAREAGMPGISRVFIFPPHSDDRLVYQTFPGRKNAPYLILDIDEDGKPITVDLYSDYGPFGALKNLVHTTYEKMGVSTTHNAPRTFVLNLLLSKADAQANGDGRLETRVHSIQEGKRTVANAEQILGINDH